MKLVVPFVQFVLYNKNIILHKSERKYVYNVNKNKTIEIVFQ